MTSEKRCVCIKTIMSLNVKVLMMGNNIIMPSKDELAELSHAELNERIQVAFDEWVEASRRGENVAEKKAIHRAYDAELLKRLHRIKKYLSRNFN